MRITKYIGAEIGARYRHGGNGSERKMRGCHEARRHREHIGEEMTKQRIKQAWQ